MITEKHYSRLNEHPQDRIFKDKEYIKRLHKHMDDIYNELCRDLRLNEEGKDFLFDYIYNEDKEIEFEEYLYDLGVRYDEICLVRAKTKYVIL
jgi:hypothetical protein